MSYEKKIDLANQAEKNGKIEEALQLYKEAIGMEPDRVDAYYNIALLFHQQGQIDEAIANFERVAELDREDASIFNNLGVLYYSKGMLVEAETSFKKAIAIKPDYAEVLYGLGKVYQKCDEVDGSSKFEQHLKQLEKIMQRLRKSGKIKSAREISELLIKLSPDDTKTQNVHAELCHELDKFEEIDDELPKVTFLDPSAYNLIPLWEEMNKRPNVICQWAITRDRASYDRLKSWGVDRIIFTPDDPKGARLNEFIAPLKSDLIVSSTWGRADSLPNSILKVEGFHALGNKAYFIKPPLAKKYDLLLFPSEFHKNLYVKYKVFAKDDPRLKVVGWHRIDCLADPDAFDKEEICGQFGIDPSKPTVFYAPTWSVYGRHGIFYRWFKNEFEIFRAVCEHIDSLGANFVVKFHPLLQKPFMTNESFWQKFLAMVDEYGHVTYIDALVNDDPQPLLYVTDVLITDISSIFADFLPLNRPVIFIEPQTDIWEQTEICSSYRTGFIVETPEQLLYAISDSFENPERFEHCRKRIFNKLVYKFDGNAAKRGVDEILKLLI